MTDNPDTLIKVTCESEFFLPIPISELRYISTHPNLNPLEKLIWINLAHEFFSDPIRICTFTYEEIANSVNHKIDEVHHAIRNLKEHGLIQVELDKDRNVMPYTLSCNSSV